MIGEILGKEYLGTESSLTLDLRCIVIMRGDHMLYIHVILRGTWLRALGIGIHVLFHHLGPSYKNGAR